MAVFQKHNLILGMLVCLLLASVFSGCQQGGPPDMPPPVVKTTVIQPQTWPLTYKASASIEANNKVDINSEVMGTVTGIYFKEGQAVQKGQTLIRFKNDKYQAQVGQSAADISSSENEISLQTAEIKRAQELVDAAQARFNLSESEYKRFQNLQQQQLISTLELEQKNSTFLTAKADLAAAQSQLASAKARLGQAESGLTRSQSSYNYAQALAGEAVIRAPFSGKVGRKFVDVGDYVVNTEKILTIVDNSLMRAIFALPEHYSGYLKNGLPVTVSLQGGQNGSLSFPARVDFIDPVIDELSRTIAVKAKIQNPQSVVRHGQSAQAVIELQQINNALAVPEEALIPRGEHYYVYVVDAEKTATLRQVEIGQRANGKALVTKGIKANERIVTDGAQKIMADGSKVTLKSDMQAPTPEASVPEPSDNSDSVVETDHRKEDKELRLMIEELAN